ncbi:MAG TPA: PKD domain-containing protein, partial [Thermoplasmatales archaeon]|nr:PKD domain-containing protein [Thermoplasmatales archaeon]
SDVRIKFVYSDTYDSTGDSGYAWGCLIDNVNLTGVEAVPPWAELIDPYTSESLDMAFVITGEPKGTVHNLDTDEWFTTIQKAIDDPDTADGHTIEVYLPMPEVFPSGKYEENVNVYKELTLVANATEATTFPYVVIDGGQAGPCITINANNVNIIGFELINGTDGVSSPGTTGSVIQNCNIHDNLNTGLYLESTMGLVIQDCRIYDNLDAGIHLESSDGNLISGCEIYNNDHVGIHLLSANDNVIEGCEFYGHHWDFGGGAFGAGVDVESSVGNDIHDNIFYDNDEGVRLWYNNDINYINFNIFGRWCEEPGIAIHNYDDVIPDARYNWYAQDNGPSGDIPDAITGRMANGYGSAVIGNLNFDPWRGIDAFIDVSSTAALVGDPITFDASNSFHYDITGTPVDDILYEWNLGNGEYKFSEMFGYPYSEPGIYKVKLSARAPDSILDEDNGVLYDTATVYITISAAGAPLEADASPDMIEGYSGNGYTGAVDEPVQFYGIATGGLPPYTYHWEFGDGTTSDEQNPLHIYRTPGQYNVALTVTDSEGNTDSDVTFAVVKAADEPVTGVEICCVKGGFGVKATINNTEATPIDWEINVTGGFILFGGHANGTIPAETTETVSSGFMLGFGKVDIHICAGTVCKDATGFLLGPFVLGVTET